MDKGSLFPTPSPALRVSCFADLRHSDWGKMNSQNCLDLCFLHRSVPEQFLRYFSDVFVLFSVLSVQVPGPFWEWALCLIVVLDSVFWVLCIFWSLLHCQVYNWQTFSTILWLPLYPIIISVAVLNFFSGANQVLFTMSFPTPVSYVLPPVFPSVSVRVQVFTP